MPHRTDPASHASELVTRLRRLDACAVSDAMDRLRLDGVVSAVPRQSGQERIAGRVITLKLGLGPAQPGVARHLGTLAVESGNSDHVIVIEQRSGIEAGSWGGILSLGAKVRQIAGVIADGPVRDVDEARQLGFTIFSRATTARTARGRIVEIGTNVPVEVWDVAVNPDDYVIADSSAVVFIRAGDMDLVLQTAEQIMEKEAAMAVAVLDGTPISAVMGGNYEHMLQG